MVFAACSSPYPLFSTSLDSLSTVGAPSGTRPPGNRPYCQHCRVHGHTIDHCFDLYLELKQQYNKARATGCGRGAPLTSAIGEMTPPSPDYSELQSQMT